MSRDISSGLVNSVNKLYKREISSKRDRGFRMCDSLERFRNIRLQVTIIVATCGLHKLPPVKSNAELKKALQTLASVPSSKIMAAVVLWTPQKKDDTLSEQELRKNYPLLYPL